MLENRNNVNRRPNAFKSLLLVFLMVMSTTLAMMVPSEWDEETTTVDVEYRSRDHLRGRMHVLYHHQPARDAVVLHDRLHERLALRQAGLVGG